MVWTFSLSPGSFVLGVLVGLLLWFFAWILPKIQLRKKESKTEGG